jgi:3'(2'), 5'-bisphosphate nucleotidase
VIWVDPLDGTAEFTSGFLDHVTILIGISFKDVAVAGVIHQPYFKTPSGEFGRSIWGIKDIAGGNQSILGGNHFTLKKPPENKFIITTTRSHSSKLLANTIQAIRPGMILEQ